MAKVSITQFFKEAQRRRVFRVAALYIVGAWITLQVADLAFPGLAIPESAIRFVWIGAIIGLPIALYFGWRYDLISGRIVRTAGSDIEADLSLKRTDKILLSALVVVVSAITLGLMTAISGTRETETIQELMTDITPQSIAVLPFRNRSALAEDAYFVDGIHDDILTRLSKVSSLEKVISRTSMEQYRETTKAMPRIGQELGVATILEGGVQRAGDKIHINVQLIDALADEHLWAETYERELTTSNIFAIQAEIATAIATALQTTLSPEEQRNIADVPTENLEAYEAYQLGRQAMERRTTKSVAAAIDLFTRATTIDTNFAQAWAGLADSYRMLAQMSGQNVDDLNEKAFAAVDRALQLNDQLSEPHTSLAYLLVIQGDFPAAVQAIQRALALNPNDANAHFRYTNVLHEIRDVENALLEFEKAVKLDPLSAVMNDAYAFTLSEVGRFDEALSRYRKVDEIDPDYPMAGVSIGTIYGLAYGRLDLANLWYRKALALDPGRPWISAILGLVFLELDDDDTAEFWINRALQQAPQHPWANGAMTMLQSYRGDAERLRQYADAVARVDPRWRFGTALSHGRVPDLRNGKYEEVLNGYRSSFPELFGKAPEVNSVTYRPAIDVAGVLLLTGEDKRAAVLLAECQQQLSKTIRVGIYGFWVSDVQILTLQGKTEEALSALRQAVDQRWRTDWRYFFYVDPNLDSIREEPEFQAILSEVEKDMAAQLERARAMEANGELAEIPEGQSY